MHDELTQVDIDKMKEELQHRIQVLRPQLIEEVKVPAPLAISVKILSTKPPSGRRTATTAAFAIWRT